MLEDHAYPRETAPGGAQNREDGTLNDGGEAKRDSNAARQAEPGRGGDRAAASPG